VLKLMVIKAKTSQDENAAIKTNISSLEAENAKLKNKLKLTESQLRISDQESKILESELILEKKTFRDLELKFKNASQGPPEYDSLQEMNNRIKAERNRNIEDRKKINFEIKKIIEEKESLEEESRKIAAIKKIIIDGKKKSGEKWKSSDIGVSNDERTVEKSSTALEAVVEEVTGSTAKMHRIREEVTDMKTVLQPIEEEPSTDELTVGEENLRSSHENQDVDAQEQIKSLRVLLTQTQEQALSDQRQDAKALQELNRKFLQLTLNYETNVVAIATNANGDISNVRNVQSEDVLIAQNQRILSLEQDNSQKDMALSVLKKDFNTVRADGERCRIHAEKLSRVLILTKEMFKKRFMDLRVQIRKTRESVEDFDPYFDGECRRLVTVFGQTIRSFSEKRSVIPESEIERLTASLNERHKAEVQSLRFVIVSQQTQMHSGKVQADLQDDNLATAGAIEKIERTVMGNIEDDKDGEEVEKNSQGVVKGTEQNNRTKQQNKTDDELLFVPISQSDPSLPMKADAAAPEAVPVPAAVPAAVPVVALHVSHDSLSNSLMSDSEHAAFESVLKGVLDSLETVGVLTQQDVGEILIIAMQNEEPSFIATSTAKSFISDKFSTSLMETKKLKSEIEILRRELKYEISEKIREKESKES
jgi:hypothetical protein